MAYLRRNWKCSSICVEWMRVHGVDSLCHAASALRLVVVGALFGLIILSSSGCAFAGTPEKILNWGSIFIGTGGIPSVMLKSGEILGTREEILARGEGGGKRVVLVELNASRTSWRDRGIIVRSDDVNADLGDGMLYEDGARILYIYRLNKFKGSYQNDPYYSIRVSISLDQGESWREHSVVEEIRPPVTRKSGLWTPSILRTNAGDLQAYYDDGDLPEEVLKIGNAGQWAVMKTWDESRKVWVRRVIVSRPPINSRGPRAITADGARTPIEVAPGHIWSPVESNEIDSLGRRFIVLRATESFDGGKSWSWENGKTPLLYEIPPIIRGQQRDWSWPLAARSKNGAVMVVFRSNQDQGERKPGTSHQVDKYLYYLWREKWTDEWVFGRVPFDEPTTDHGVAPTPQGGFVVVGRTKKNPREYIFSEISVAR